MLHKEQSNNASTKSSLQFHHHIQDGCAPMSLNGREWFPRGMQNGLIAGFLSAVLVLTALSLYVAVREHHGYIVGDWLVNYQDGFVRRGLCGEMILLMARRTEFSLGAIVGWVQFLAYLFFIVFGFLNLLQQRCLKPYWLLVFSPFIFCFQIVTIGAGGRKEILFFAMLSILVWIANRFDERVLKRAVFATLATYPFLILTHEMMALFLPLLLIVHFSKCTPSWKDAVWMLPLLVISGAVFLLSLKYTGSMQTSSAIHRALENAGYSVEYGAIDWLGRTLEQSVETVKHGVFEGDFLEIYGVVLVLVFVVFMPVFPRLRLILGRWECRIAAGFSGAGVLTMFGVANDWGRWLYIYLVGLFLLSLLKPDPDQTMPQGRLSWGWLAALSVVSLLCWHIPCYGEAWPICLNPVRMFKHVQGDGLLP